MRVVRKVPGCWPRAARRSGAAEVEARLVRPHLHFSRCRAHGHARPHHASRSVMPSPQPPTTLPRLLDRLVPPSVLEARLAWGPRACAALEETRAHLEERHEPLTRDERAAVALAAARFLGPRPPGAEGWDGSAARTNATGEALSQRLKAPARETLPDLEAAPGSQMAICLDADVSKTLEDQEPGHPFRPPRLPEELLRPLLLLLPALLPAPSGISANARYKRPAPGSERHLPRDKEPIHIDGEARAPSLAAGAAVWLAVHAAVTLSAAAWDLHVPSLLPALLAVVSDPSPATRLVGLHCSAELLVGSPTARTYLLRSNLAALFNDHCQTSLTYSSDPLGPALLCAATRLSLHLPDATSEDCWHRCAGLADAILRACAYYGAVPPMDVPPQAPAGSEPTDLLCAAFDSFVTLAPVLGSTGTARTLPMALEFCAAHIALAADTAHKSLQRRRARAAVSACSALLDASRSPTGMPPGIAAWSARILASVAKASVGAAAEDAACLRGAWQEWYAVAPLETQTTFAQLGDVDQQLRVMLMD
ncbi:hypothetical protein FA09DRAFT_138561 [Tilletiopsis washingtonensis]|uniref:Uncharacterized protein n=1 Tax=Tilletiopsis washingtonensis TaxID=58919 RepID=A0A316Z1R2_9BASI|nr:hypothetical protein FA09DRAFT_138561 [Tilletiopsis washingtonensis]PWN95730.1 hypothetical protein FA09DRAFT_138561 [Tilletiopsis washingtonensis]